MNEFEHTNRRTVLRSIGASIAGGTVITGSTRAAPGRARGRRNDIRIVAEHDHQADEHFFEVSPDEVSAGWTTVEFDNRTDHTHFVFLQKVPKAAQAEAAARNKDLLEYWVEQITDPFQVFMDWILGKEPAPPTFPDWFGDIVFSGGTGLTSGHTTSRTTVDLDPGIYQVECYVKNAANEFHSYLGMVDLLTVTGDESGVAEPEATLDVSISSSDGIVADGAVRPGQHTVGIEFVDQQQYANLVGHDVHLIRFDGATDAEDVNGWMDWTSGDGLVSDGTEPGRFLGGVQDIWTTDLPETGYMHVNLKPGEYAWVAEVPRPDEKGLFQEFSVPFGRGTGRG